MSQTVTLNSLFRAGSEWNADVSVRLQMTVLPLGRRFQLFWEACCMMTEHRLNICRYSSAPSDRHLLTTWTREKTSTNINFYMTYQSVLWPWSNLWNDWVCWIIFAKTQLLLIKCCPLLLFSCQSSGSQLFREGSAFCVYMWVKMIWVRVTLNKRPDWLNTWLRYEFQLSFSLAKSSVQIIFSWCWPSL